MFFYCQILTKNVDIQESVNEISRNFRGVVLKFNGKPNLRNKSST